MSALAQVTGYEKLVSRFGMIEMEYGQCGGLWKVVDWDVHIIEESNRYCKSKRPVLARTSISEW